jgi:hypothetical protein
MNLNPITAAGKRLAKWLLPHILDEVQKEVATVQRIIRVVLIIGAAIWTLFRLFPGALS